MIRRFPIIGKILTAALPLILVWGWAACPVFCDDVVEQNQRQNASVDEWRTACGIAPAVTDECRIAGHGALLEARHDKISPPAAAPGPSASCAPLSGPAPAAFAAAASGRRPPPRGDSPPLYLAHRAFRI